MLQWFDIPHVFVWEFVLVYYFLFYLLFLIFDLQTTRNRKIENPESHINRGEFGFSIRVDSCWDMDWYKWITEISEDELCSKLSTAIVIIVGSLHSHRSKKKFFQNEICRHVQDPNWGNWYHDLVSEIYTHVCSRAHVLFTLYVFVCA